MAFVVSARKYRPVRFDEVVGQGHVSQTLKNALQTDHVAHAFLFCGPRGVGKTTCARILAKVLNCENITSDYEACNTCSSCSSFNENASFNIHELDAASNNSVDHIRSLTEQVRFQPQQGKYKIYIIDEVHMLSQQAFNAFLKTLEEPPPYAIFILATTEKHKIIPTILSRCQIFDFNRIQIADIVGHLERICKAETIEYESEALHIIAQKADGALRDGLSIFDRMVSFSNESITYEGVIKNLNILDYDYYFKVVDCMLKEDMGGVMLLFDEILSNGFEPDIFINGLAEHIRNLLVCKDEGTLRLLEVGEAAQARYRTQAKISGTSFLLTALSLANDCDVHYKMARNKRLHAEMSIIKMCHIGAAYRLGEQQKLGAVEEKKTPDQSVTSSGKEEVEVKVKEEPRKEGEKLASNPSKEKEVEPPKKEVKSSLLSNKISLSLNDIEASVEEEGAKEEKEIPLELGRAQNAWNKYVAQHRSPSIRNHLKGVALAIVEDDLQLTLGGNFIESAIKGEHDLLPFLKKELQRKELQFRFIIDKKQLPEPPKVVKPLTDMEKYQKMNQNNPLVSDLQKRFGLKFD